MLRLLIVVALSVLTSSYARAETIGIQSRLNAEGQYSVTQVLGELSYDQSTSKFKVVLENVTDPSIQVTNITGFLFNIAQDGFFAKLDPNPTLSPDSVDAFYDVNGPESATPYGTFEFGAAFQKGSSGDGDWDGGGNGSKGIANGQIGVFEFLVKDSSNVLAGNRLTTHDFFSEQSTPSSPSIEPALFVVRVKAPGEFSEKLSMVPLPSSAAGGLLVFGVMGMITARRHLGSTVRSVSA